MLTASECRALHDELDRLEAAVSIRQVLKPGVVGALSLDAPSRRVRRNGTARDVQCAARRGSSHISPEWFAVSMGLVRPAAQPATPPRRATFRPTCRGSACTRDV